MPSRLKTLNCYYGSLLIYKGHGVRQKSHTEVHAKNNAVRIYEGFFVGAKWSQNDGGINFDLKLKVDSERTILNKQR